MDLNDMKFTPQQLAGGLRYQHSTRVGNWQEDQELEWQRQKEYELRKGRGELMLTQKARQSAALLQNIPLSYSKDGLIHFGDTVMLLNRQGSLSCNPFSAGFGMEDVMASVIPTEEGLSRNALVVEKAAGEHYEADNVLRYGDCFCLATHPSLRQDALTGVVRPPFYLFSSLKQGDRLAKRSREQEVCFTLEKSPNSMFKIIPRQVVQRGLLEGNPVMAGTPVAIFHVRSNQALACDDQFDLLTDYGREFEVYCKTTTTNGRVYPVVKEHEGKRIAQQGAKPEREANLWYITMSESPVEEKKDYLQMTPENILGDIRTAMLSKGDRGGIGLLRALQVLEDKKGHLCPSDLKFGFKDVGLTLEKYELEILVSGFSRDAEGGIQYSDLSRALIPELDSENIQKSNEIFSRIQSTTFKGDVTVTTLREHYNLSAHPGVSSGRVSIDQALEEFIRHWRFTQKVGIVTESEFLEYHILLGAFFHSDAATLQHYMESAWKV